MPLFSTTRCSDSYGNRHPCRWPEDGTQQHQEKNRQGCNAICVTTTRQCSCLGWDGWNITNTNTTTVLHVVSVCRASTKDCTDCARAPVTVLVLVHLRRLSGFRTEAGQRILNYRAGMNHEENPKLKRNDRTEFWKNRQASRVERTRRLSPCPSWTPHSSPLPATAPSRACTGLAPPSVRVLAAKEARRACCLSFHFSESCEPSCIVHRLHLHLPSLPHCYLQL